MAGNEPMYCSQQINIPPELPDILKQFTKAAIRTQPTDVLQWAFAYFEALNKKEHPPVKERLDFQLGQALDNPITKGALVVLHKQLGDRPIVECCKVSEKWNALCLPQDSFEEIIKIGAFPEEFKWLEFLSLACSNISPNLTITMQNVCDILTKDLEGGPSRIQFDLFKTLYSYLAKIDGEISQEHMDDVLEHLSYNAEKQNGLIGPGNFLNESCPKLSTDT